MKTLMILGAGILQLPAILKAREMGIRTVAVDMDPRAVGFDQADVALEISTIDTPKVLQAAKAQGIDGIMTLASDMPMRTVAAVAKEMGLIGISDETALKATDKAVMRACLQEHAVPIPQFFKATTYDEYKQAAAAFSVPFVVKPADNSGSRGIFQIDDPTDEAAIEEAYRYSKPFARGGTLVIEEYMRGAEVSVETLSINGECHVIQITDKLTTGAPHFVEMGHSQPTRLGVETAQKIADVARAAVRAVGIENGPSHTEIIVTEEGPKVVEIGARLGGDCITTHLVPLSTGVDMVECCIRIALGDVPNVTPKFEKGSAIRYLPSHEGWLKSISGLDNARAVDGVQQIEIVKTAGQAIPDIHSSGDRIGFVIAQHDSADAAVAAAMTALDQIQVEIE